VKSSARRCPTTNEKRLGEKFNQPVDDLVGRPAVRRIGQEGNAFNILGLCQRAARRAGWTQERIDVVMAEMRSGDYSPLVQTAMKYFEVT
jgi:hypothetical protein